MNDLLNRYLSQKERVKNLYDEIDTLQFNLQQAEHELSCENAILDSLAADIAKSDDPIIVAIRKLYKSGELK